MLSRASTEITLWRTRIGAVIESTIILNCYHLTVLELNVHTRTFCCGRSYVDWRNSMLTIDALW